MRVVLDIEFVGSDVGEILNFFGSTNLSDDELRSVYDKVFLKGFAII